MLRKGETMNPDKKKDYIKTGLIAGFFLILALVLLDMLIGSAMSPDTATL